MATTRAKFYCHEITRRMNYSYEAKESQEVHNAKLSAVSSGSEENKMFFRATPTGSIELSTIKPDVFQLGKYYYVDFIEAE